MEWWMTLVCRCLYRLWKHVTSCCACASPALYPRTCLSTHSMFLREKERHIYIYINMYDYTVYSIYIYIFNSVYKATCFVCCLFQLVEHISFNNHASHSLECHAVVQGRPLIAYSGFFTVFWKINVI